MKKIRSRIMEIFNKEILKEMYELQSKRLTWGVIRGQRSKVEYTAKMKVQDMTNILTKYLQGKGHSFSFPGAGTNRMTVLIDGYIYKIALDQDGYIDNLNEFILSKEAQPYVTKTYETNGLIAVAEYVTLISYEEFVEKKAKILEILDDISREYLIGDMGWTQKNYANWGYRKNSDDLVILDFGHMHRLSGEKLLCKECCSILQYNSNYTKLKCLNCGKEEEFMTIKLRLSKKEERDNIDEQLKKAYQLTEPVRMVEESEIIPEEVYEDDDEELVSTRFARFAPKKKKRFEYRPELDVKEEINEIPVEVYDDVIDEYMKVVKGKVKIKDKNKKEINVVKEVKDPIQIEIEDINDDVLAEEYVFNLFIMDKIDESQYNYYMDCIENGFDRDEEEIVEYKVPIQHSGVNKNQTSYPIKAMDVINADEEKIFELDDDKSFVFDDEESDPMMTLLKELQNDFNDEEDGEVVDVEEDVIEDTQTTLLSEDEIAKAKQMTAHDVSEIVDVEDNKTTLLTQDEIAKAKQIIGMANRGSITTEPSMYIKPAQITDNKELLSDKIEEDESLLDEVIEEQEEVSLSIKTVEENMETEEEVGIKMISSNNDKNISIDKQESKDDNEVGIKIKPKDSVKVIDVTNKNNEEESVGIKVVQSKTFSNEEIMLKMKEIQDQRVQEMQEENDDYSHYEDEYAYLYEDEVDKMSNRRTTKQWK